MEIETQYASRLFHPRAAFIQVYLEALANAFDAGASEVSIRIVSAGGISPDMLEITISDDGVGFTDERYDTFARIKAPGDPYHKGVGRLVYLQYFDRIEVESVFGDGKQRFFVFTSGSTSVEKHRVGDSDGAGPPQTGAVLKFSAFSKRRLSAFSDVVPSVLKDQIVEHFLPLLQEKKRKGEDFRVSISLERPVQQAQGALTSSDCVLTAEDLPEFREKVFTWSGAGMFEDHGTIAMSYSIRDAGSQARVLAAVSVDGRTHPIPLIQPEAVPAGYSVTVLFDSPLFVGRTDHGRQKLVWPEELSQEDLFRTLRRELGAVLNAELPQIETRNKKTREDFENRYPHLVGLFEDTTVGIVARDDALETAQRRFFQKQKKVLEADKLDDATFQQSLDLSSRTLTEYVLYRAITIQRLRGLSPEDPESTAHNLIVPRFEVFEGQGMREDVYRNNAWLLDDKFMSFRTILSDKKMEEVISAITLEDEKGQPEKPDISMIFSADPDDSHPVDVAVAEVKKRGADKKENTYVISQLVDRATRLADYCPNIERMWYFGIVDVSEDLARHLRSRQWKPLFSRGQHLYYLEHPIERQDGEIVPTPIYIVSYDTIVEDAAARNHTFLEVLKAEIRRAGQSVATQ